MTSPPPTRPGSTEPPETSGNGHVERKEEESETSEVLSSSEVEASVRDLVEEQVELAPPNLPDTSKVLEVLEVQEKRIEIWMGSSPPPEFVAGPAKPVQVRGRRMEKPVHKAPTDPEPSRERLGVPPDAREVSTLPGGVEEEEMLSPPCLNCGGRRGEGGLPDWCRDCSIDMARQVIECGGYEEEDVVEARAYLRYARVQTRREKDKRRRTRSRGKPMAQEGPGS
jgi:hypothetical protein